MGHNKYPENAIYYHLAKCGQTKDSTNKQLESCGAYVFPFLVKNGEVPSH